MIVLAFNPGSASLKFEVVETSDSQQYASQGTKLLSASLEDIGKTKDGRAKLLVFRGREIDHTEDCYIAGMAEGASFALDWLEQKQLLQQVTLAGVRVVHGGSHFASAVRFDPEVRSKVEALQELAPLHNKNSLSIIQVLQKKQPRLPIVVAFDTAFHRSLPETAWRYPIERESADRYGVRKYGFHGLSHRYMLETYAQAVQKRPDEISIVTLHLESGSSACAIAKGKSIDTTMGLTPLEGLMMGTRSGSIDPAIVPHLMKKSGMNADDTMTILNKKSGLLGIAGGTFDTRELVKRNDPAARLAMRMFSYRVRLAVGAYLAALGQAEAVLFGGGIGENTPSVRAEVCAGLTGWGLTLDGALNDGWTSGQVCLTRPASRLHAWVIPVEEGLQIAHECMLALS